MASLVLSCPAFSCRPRPTQPKSYTVSEALTNKQACPNFSSVMQKQGIPVQLCEPCLHQKSSYIFPNHAKSLSHHYPHVFAPAHSGWNWGLLRRPTLVFLVPRGWQGQPGLAALAVLVQLGEAWHRGAPRLAQGHTASWPGTCPPGSLAFNCSLCTLPGGSTLLGL